MQLGDYIYLEDSIGAIIGQIVDTYLNTEIFDVEAIKLYDRDTKKWIDYTGILTLNLNHVNLNIFKYYSNYEDLFENHFEAFL